MKEKKKFGARARSAKKQAVGKRKQGRRATTPLRKQTIAKSKAARNTLARVNQVVRRMRSDGLSLRKAARESKVAPRTVLKRAASALRRGESGRYTAKSSDRQIRTLVIPTPEGPKEIDVRGLREASRLGRYWAAVHKHYETGDTSVQKFSGQFVTATDGVKYPLLTDIDVLNRLGSAGVLSFESLYGRSA